MTAVATVGAAPGFILAQRGRPSRSRGNSYQINGCANVIRGRPAATVHGRPASCCMACEASPWCACAALAPTPARSPTWSECREVMVKRYSRFSRQRENALAAVHYLDKHETRTAQN